MAHEGLRTFWGARREGEALGASRIEHSEGGRYLSMGEKPMIAAIYVRKSTDQNIADEEKSVTRRSAGGRRS